MQSTFLAWMFRMPLIKRWSLMFCVKPENVAEHSHQVAIVAHLLAVIRNQKFSGNINADKVATVALYHEASETRFGDIVSPTKYANPEIAREFKKIEYIAEKQCLQSLPEEFQAMFADIIVQDNVDEQYKKIVKAADILVAYIKALDELNHQNHEFDHVKERLELKLDTIKQQMPEVGYFMDVFLQSCSATVDKLTEVQVKK
ncbi:5'-deoxynucleotidase [Colwellia sp. MB02u-18]|uniref:5'-deoxynucleotidase n=1 Tax=unclassified Colwellia TaxID=196834 RepID=UPI0015F54010|nr:MULTISPECIES: 5'-deoxynucleotidase [unclassified Colwellia]MBA6225046.1 5'-deoxynucleotidase [Colwellia sp. MB3u-45]MBA6268666.1 5'-deoxynucleotidase [Colwellia sp. MB3u-43]MBA6321097.1 5'-deoxynucleotidase [Colwellia sp. MB02u-19]MBA6325650.1 5'-deoxynucleotidase [Colwellia sp. MB02u-18]MBA6332125.1 5'-deoxynucleotidase [Colwellia sp. MB02u-12]